MHGPCCWWFLGLFVGIAVVCRYTLKKITCESLMLNHMSLKPGLRRVSPKHLVPVIRLAGGV